mmetsp:Transcript_12003/g.21284  ORF Transcript_12003/g.21284 Transcript_12003/m.21284 type:complete len:379 (+) Transcript_12003:30-1166(+)|eukprot:CAMPEP_0119107946 /NCGR_PEP_ID=MMETSP1180-20130426/12586_1 /TAXON_ID=3052 ORGANISM="Chlamydomonas cf sp, Strain CCMP681" /NCGR_SAMPLE_ID=MMETSP1180 /ASSEMBLY_ACC=CAM_ASM_000741 /LENGTH=378 /DNA_ID=CAMNT_0007093499 /DNA_START=30 /DNA_END=1166 /DNA_ORIENTATION=-
MFLQRTQLTARPCTRGFGHPPVLVAGKAVQRAERSAGLRAVVKPAPSAAFDIEERIQFLQRDLTHLFDEQGIDSSAYNDKVEFLDPITKYDSLEGYLFNIKMLKVVFKPQFQLHDIQAAGPTAVVSRWTMIMDFTPAQFLPLPWKPQLIFTGTSRYEFNELGKIYKHIDTWDSISDQQFLSFEAVRDLSKQFLATYSVPKDLQQPDYTILRRAAEYQVRQYQPYLVAETAGKGFQTFGTLAKYIFGGNERNEQMSMTTPVFSDATGRMGFVIDPTAHKDLGTVPKPTPGAAVSTRTEPGGIWAVRVFGGIADERDAEKEAQKLFKALDADGISYEEGGWRLARYNDPGTLPPFRKNEVQIRLKEPFELWLPGEISRTA